ncbi:hypothetical protein CEXT_344081 [Caerostris extrusa]|uniref:Uncharacterized protein n=1 Tax=Caerostris extrusa TaxID=172846 RepID=A0AAV4Y6R8_CAEEX|nr:hypothetical protein CEXT_344081 [Caerostris extrusa]
MDKTEDQEVRLSVLVLLVICGIAILRAIKPNNTLTLPNKRTGLGIYSSIRCRAFLAVSPWLLQQIKEFSFLGHFGSVCGKVEVVADFGREISTQKRLFQKGFHKSKMPLHAPIRNSIERRGLSSETERNLKKRSKVRVLCKFIALEAFIKCQRES